MIQIFTDLEQGSAEWLEARMGIPTASMFATLLGIKKDAKEKVTRQIYMRKLAGEILTGEPMDNFQNDHMQRGNDQEAEARDLYSFMKDIEPQRVGFIRNGSVGCSPDSLIGDKGGLEIKTALAHIQIDRLQKDVLPPEYRAQVQGNLWLAERQWWDFCSYSPKLPLLVVRVPRDPDYIATLSDGVKEFNAELAELVDQIRNYGKQKAAA